MLIVAESGTTIVNAGENSTFFVQAEAQQTEDEYKYLVCWTTGDPREWSIKLGTRTTMDAAKDLLRTIEGRLWARVVRYSVEVEK